MPQSRQKPRSAAEELRKMAGAPLVQAIWFMGTPATAMNRLPTAFWHIRQWQMSAEPGAA